MMRITMLIESNSVMEFTKIIAPLKIIKKEKKKKKKRKKKESIIFY